jgi:hypothetical protein
MHLSQRSCGRRQRPPDCRVASGHETQPTQSELPRPTCVSSRTLGWGTASPNPCAQPQDMRTAASLQCGGRLLHNQSMLQAAAHDEDLPRLKVYRLGALKFVAEGALSAAEHRLFIIAVPREGTRETKQPQHRAVQGTEIERHASQRDRRDSRQRWRPTTSYGGALRASESVDLVPCAARAR